MKRTIRGGLILFVLVAATLPVMAADVIYNGTTTLGASNPPTWGADRVILGTTTPASILTIEGGITAATSGEFYVGNASASSGNSLVVEGAGTSLQATNSFYLGRSSGNNSMEVREGALALTTSFSATFYFGGSSSNGNSLKVTGAGSMLGRNLLTMTLGNGGSDQNSLTVDDGGRVALSTLNIGNVSGAQSNAVTVSGSNSQITTTSINMGLSDSSSTIGNSITITDGGSLTSTGRFNLYGNNSVTIRSGGILNVRELVGGSSPVGTITLGGGTLKVDNTLGTNVAGIVLESDTTSIIEFNGTNSGSFNSTSGSGNLIKNGTGTLNMYNGNTFTGDLTINAGIVALANTWSSAPGKIINNSQLNLTGTVVVGSNISGNGQVRQVGGMTTLSGVNTYTGKTTVVASSGFGGATIFGKRASFYNGDTTKWAPSMVTVSEKSALGLRVGGEGEFTAADIDLILSQFGNSTSSTGMASGSFLQIDTTNAGGDYALTNNISNLSGGNVIGLAKSGTNTLKLTGTNTYTGGTWIRSGWLEAAAANLGSGPITLSGSINSGFKFGSDLTLTDVRLDSNGGGVDTNGYNGAITGLTGGSSFWKYGEGRLDLDVASIGQLSVNGGEVRVRNTVGMGANASLSVSNAEFDLDGGTMQRTFVSMGNSVLTVRNGGKLSTTTSTFQMSNGYALITGKSSAGVASELNVTGISMGNFSSDAKLEIKDGASLKSGNTTSTIGVGNTSYADSGNRNKLTVSGNGSRASFMASISVGYGIGSANEFRVEDGGVVDALLIASGALRIGKGNATTAGFGSDNSVIVTGEDSVFSYTGNIYIGESGSLGTGNNLTVSDEGLFKFGSSTVGGALTIADGNYLRLDGGYFAWYGDKVDELAALIALSKVQYDDNGTWVAGGAGDFAVQYFLTAEEAQAFTNGNYGDLENFTVLKAIPEPGTWALLGLGAGVVGFLRWRRK